MAYQLPRAVTYVPYYASPFPIPIPVPVARFQQPIPQIKIKVIFWGHQKPGHARGFWCAQKEVAYDAPPSRAQLLANLSFFAKEANVEHPIFAGQAKLYLTRGRESLEVLNGKGPVVPADLVKGVEMSESMPDNKFRSMMEDIRTKQYGAFIVIDMDVRAKFAELRCEKHSNPVRSTSDTSDNMEAGRDGEDIPSSEDAAQTSRENGEGEEQPAADPQPGASPKGKEKAAAQGDSSKSHDSHNADPSSAEPEPDPPVSSSSSANAKGKDPMQDTPSPQDGEGAKNDQQGDFNDLLV